MSAMEDHYKDKAPMPVVVINPIVTTTLSIDGSVHGTQASAGSIALVLTTTKPNDVILVFIETNGDVVTGVTASGLTFAFRGRSGSGIQWMEEWWAIAAVPLSAVTITANITSANFISATAFGINGAKTSAPFDTNGVLPVLSNTDPISVSTTAPNTMIVGGFRVGTASPTNGAGYTPIQLNPDFLLTEYKIVSVPQSGLSVTVGTGAGASNGSIGDAIVQGP